jgi:hypothetical protein
LRDDWSKFSESDMKNRLSLFAVLLLVCLTLGAQSASARSLKQLSHAQIIVGHTSYGLVNRYDLNDQQDVPPEPRWIQMRNLFTGKSKRLAIPSGYGPSTDRPVAGYGYWADDYGTDYKIFVTGAKGIRTLPAATQAAPDACTTRRRAMRVVEGGGVVVLEAVYLPRVNPGDTDCPIDAAKTNLTLFKADGSSEKLWLPDEYSRLLDHANVNNRGWAPAELRGNRLMLFSQSMSSVPSSENSFVVLDVKKQKVLRKVTGLGMQLDDVTFSGSNAVLATLWGGSGASTVTRYPLNGGKARVFYKGILKNFTPMACGARTIILPKFGHYRILGKTGRTVKRVRGRGWPICSSEVAYFFSPSRGIYLPKLGR